MVEGGIPLLLIVIVVVGAVVVVYLDELTIVVCILCTYSVKVRLYFCDDISFVQCWLLDYLLLLLGKT